MRLAWRDHYWQPACVQRLQVYFLTKARSYRMVLLCDAHVNVRVAARTNGWRALRRHVACGKYDKPRVEQSFVVSELVCVRLVAECIAYVLEH